LFAVAVLTLSFGYISRARVWTSEDHFHAQTAVDSPRSAKAHFNLGQHLARRDRPEDAEKALARALAIYPAFDQAAYYRSALLLKLDRPYEAEGVWKSYLAYKPEDAGALSHLLGILVSVERYDEAIPLTQRLILLVPENNDFRSLLVRLEMMSDYQRGLEPLSP